jgi:hypothetical protein
MPGERKRFILEHPITGGTGLTIPGDSDERTDSVYRFSMTLPAERALSITVREESPREERITLVQLHPEIFAAYASTQEIPDKVRTALLRAIELKKTPKMPERLRRKLKNGGTWRLRTARAP